MKQQLLIMDFPQVVFAITITLVGFLLYYLPAANAQIENNRRTGPEFWLRHIFIQKFRGFLFMGFLPAVAFGFIYGFPIPLYGLDPGAFFKYWPWLLLTIIIPPIFNYFLARNPATQEQYPQMRIFLWTPKYFVINVLGWLIYLLAYEYLFRGILLFSLYDAFGFWPAVAISVTIYSLAHLPKGAGETIGAIPFGVVLCTITLFTGTLLFSVLAHLALALSNDYFAIRYNPEMAFKTNSKNE